VVLYKFYYCYLLLLLLLLLYVSGNGLQAAEEQRLKEEQAQREHEEYLKMKEAFTVDAEGTDAIEEQDVNIFSHLQLSSGHVL